MPDPTAAAAMMDSVVNFISAAGGLGTAAMGLVDATKSLNGGPSNVGFADIQAGVTPFLPPPTPGVRGRGEILRSLRANWLNGVPKADQKAKAKALIHLGLTPASATGLANAAGVSAADLQGLATAVAAGAAPTQAQINVLGEFDVVLAAALDAAYERADQKYRNACKSISMIVATLLAVIGGWLLYAVPDGGSRWGYLQSSQLVLAILVGLSATPLAPVTKDLVSSLQAAVGAVRAVRR